MQVRKFDHELAVFGLERGARAREFGEQLRLLHELAANAFVHRQHEAVGRRDRFLEEREVRFVKLVDARVVERIGAPAKAARGCRPPSTIRFPGSAANPAARGP